MEHVTKHLQAYIDGELPTRDRHRVEEHCAHCAECARELAALQAVWATVTSAHSGASESSLERSLLTQVRRRLAERSRGGVGGFGAMLTGSQWPRLARAGFASAAVTVGLAVGLMAGGPGSARVGDGGVIEIGLTDRTEAMNLLEESSNLYGGDWALDQLWLAAAYEEESVR